MLILLINTFICSLCLFGLYRCQQRKTHLTFCILISLLLGISVGALMQWNTNNDALMDGLTAILRLLGLGYLGLLKMLVIPLILTSIIHALLQLGRKNSEMVQKISFIAVLSLLSMTAASSLIGLAIGQFFSIGTGMSFPTVPVVEHMHTYTGLTDTLLGMIPSNPVAMMAKENTAAVVIFAVLLGLAARKLDLNDHDKMETFSQLISSLFAITKKLASLILSFTPYAIFLLNVDDGC